MIFNKYFNYQTEEDINQTIDPNNILNLPLKLFSENEPQRMQRIRIAD